MKSIYTSVIFLIFLSGNCIGQYTCGTPDMDSTAFVNKPWIGNNQFLLDIADSVGYGNTAIPKSASGGFDPVAVYWIPVKAWVYNDNSGDGGIDEIEVEESIARLNEFFAGEVNDNGNAHSQTLLGMH